MKTKNLLTILVLGIVVSGVVYAIYKNIGKKEILPLVQEKTPKPEEATGVNFTQKGSLFAREDGWIFLWDEPGRLALNVKLTFTDQSVCYLGGENKPCDLINMGSGSYDYVSVEGVRNDSEVTVVKLEELRLPTD